MLPSRPATRPPIPPIPPIAAAVLMRGSGAAGLAGLAGLESALESTAASCNLASSTSQRVTPGASVPSRVPVSDQNRCDAFPVGSLRGGATTSRTTINRRCLGLDACVPDAASCRQPRRAGRPTPRGCRGREFAQLSLLPRLGATAHRASSDGATAPACSRRCRAVAPW